MEVVEIFQIAAAVITSTGGAAAVLWGLSSFLAKVWVNRLLEQDRARHGAQLENLRNEYQQDLERLRADLDTAHRRLQANIDRTVFVHRVQFEAEFNAMQAIWAKVITLRGFMAGLRPTFSIGPVNETKEEALEKLRDRFATFDQSLEDAKDAIFQNEPFVSESLYRELYDNLLRAAQAEAINVRVHARDRAGDWYEQGEKISATFKPA